MIYRILLVFIISLNAFAFDKDFIAINDRVPLEFNLLFESMKLGIKTPSEKLRIIGLSKDLNDNLGFLQKEHIFMLMKTEVIKSTLEYKFDKVRQFDMNTLLISRLEDDYNAKKAYLNSFSKWIWQSVLAELNHRKKMGLITSASFNPTIFTGTKRLEALRFQRYLQYLYPWIDKMDSLDASNFNKLSKEVSWSIMERINDRSILFKRYASTATGDTQTKIINIPHKLSNLKPEEIKSMQNDTMPMTLTEQSKVEKVKAAEQIDKVTPLDMSTMSDDLATELENKTQAPAKAP
ncbi:MAG: hypothetical protein H0V66_09200 [Bdellovibrionales bacterium]|nr:hypothetical protein [Bdellovibrionales bacterium]